MRDIDRIDDFLARFAAIWKAHPDLRFNQLILNIFENPMHYYIEDEDMIKSLEEYYNNPSWN